MKRRGSSFLSCLIVGSIAPLLSVACAWDPYIPNRPAPISEVEVDPSTLADQLPLGTAYVGKLDCYSKRCQKRFRVVVDESGQLTVRLIPQLVGPDAQARLVLEGMTRVLARDVTQRGDRSDVIVLAVREPVDPGVYFVLLQSLGGPMPYEVSASLLPGEGPGASAAEQLAAREARMPTDPPPDLVKLKGLRQGTGASYDPATSYETVITFQFPSPPPAVEGALLDRPEDRQIRRFLASDLKLKGFRQASGAAEADLVVDFSTGASPRIYGSLPRIYDSYGFGLGVGHYGVTVDERAGLTVDIIERETNRIAWHAYTTMPLGPGVDTSKPNTAMVRKAVTEVLSRFPPR